MFCIKRQGPHITENSILAFISLEADVARYQKYDSRVRAGE